MTTSTYTGTTDSDRDRARRATGPIAAGSLAVAVALSVTNAHSTAEWIVEVVVAAASAGIAFGLVVPRGLRHSSAGGRGIVMSAIALLVVVPAFWTGLPMVLGSAGALLGYAGKRAPSGSGRATVSLVLGLLAVVAYLAIYVLDYLDTHGIAIG